MQERSKVGEETIGYCWYCSEIKELGDPDHVVPGTLFAHKNQSTLTLPCCRACNTRKSHGETELAIYLLAQKESGRHPAAQHMWPEAARAIRKNLSKVGRAAAAATWQPHTTTNGLYLGHELTADLGDAAKPIVESLRYMMHGLHVTKSHHLLPQGTPVETLIIPPEHCLSTVQDLGPIMNCGPYGLGPEQSTVRWVGRVDEETPNQGVWLIEFFESVLVVGFVGAALPKTFAGQHRLMLKRAQKRQAERLEQLGLIVGKPVDYLDFLGRAQSKCTKSRR